MIQLEHKDFAEAISIAKKGDFTYIDPPYDPVSNTSPFTGYSFDRFGRNEPIRLKELVDELTQRRCRMLLSNSATEFIQDLYKGYHIEWMEATRVINSNASRGEEFGSQHGMLVRFCVEGWPTEKLGQKLILLVPYEPNIVRK